ncbi:MAG: SAM-dependent methyltransferase [Pseudonocardiaceae bacterium]
MTEQAEWVPQGIDVELPSGARIYDYLLGGGHNFALDRQLGEQFAAVVPGARDIVRINRAFLRRAVLFLVSSGVRQFLDLGSGIPTVGNVHEIAQQADEQARVVYVDKEPVAVAHSRLLLEGNERATIVQADMCEAETILQAPETRRLIDFDEPVGLLMVAVFHFVPDERRPQEIVAAYRDRLVSGSYLALSHLTADTMPEEMAAAVEVSKRMDDQFYLRSREEITALFAGFDLVEPGAVSAPLWRPESPAVGPDAEHSEVFAGVGRRS